MLDTRSRSREALGLALESYRPVLIGYFSQVRGIDAEDAAAEVIARVLASNYQEQGQLRRFVFRSSRRLKIDLLRKSGRCVPLEEAAAAALPLVTDARSLLAEMAARVSMSAKVYRTLVLFYVEDLPQRAIADLLGLEVGTVKSRVRAGCARLAAGLRQADWV